MFKKIEGIYTAAKQAFKKNPNPGAAIKSVKTNVPDTKLKKLQAANKIATQRLKGAQAKLKQTNYEAANKAFKGKDDFTFAKSNKKSESNREAYKRIQGENTKAIKSIIDDAFSSAREKKAKGGRVGLKGGSFPDLSGDGKTTFKDILIGRGVIKKGKKGKKTDTPIQKAVKKDKKKKVI